MTTTVHTPEPDYALRLRGVSKRFGGVTALHDVSFDVNRGEVHCLAGENGCGKSTLIKIITGVHAPEPGAEVEVFGETQTSIKPNQARAKGIAVIWQDLALFPHMSVAENIAFDDMVGNMPKLVRRGTARKRVSDMLERLGV
ncbi:MAG: ATP-binding cassette domain-containing protein, partial [Pseudomonadota bacterium]